MVNLILGLFLETRINPSQHGHRKGKGSISCWKEILNEFPKYKFIYEFDFEKFHDNIDRAFLINAMREIGISKE